MRWRSVGCKCYVQQRPAADPGRTISGNERSASQDMRGASCEKTYPGFFDRCACVGRGPRTPHLVRQTRSKPPLLCHTMLAVSSHSASPHWRVPPRGERSCGAPSDAAFFSLPAHATPHETSVPAILRHFMYVCRRRDAVPGRPRRGLGQRGGNNRARTSYLSNTKRLSRRFLWRQ